MKYDEDYFLYGKEKGLSLYEDYRWLPALTIPMAKTIAKYLHLSWNDIILDYGCARGYLVRALQQLGYEVYGYDVSKWAIENADPYVVGSVSNNIIQFADGYVDWIIAKDVLEHVQDVDDTIQRLQQIANAGVFAVVPLGDGNRYVVPEYDMDVTHIHRLTLDQWMAKFLRPGWAVLGQYRVPGIKDNYAQYELGNGFITAKRI